jgi:hypothetical protein
LSGAATTAIAQGADHGKQLLQQCCTFTMLRWTVREEYGCVDDQASAVAESDAAIQTCSVAGC